MQATNTKVLKFNLTIFDIFMNYMYINPRFVSYLVAIFQLLFIFTSIVENSENHDQLASQQAGLDLHCFQNRIKTEYIPFWHTKEYEAEAK